MQYPQPVYGQPQPVVYGQPQMVYAQPQVYAQPAAVYVQPGTGYLAGTLPPPVIDNPAAYEDHEYKINHMVHILLCLVTLGLWTPCYIAACCHCGCESPCNL